MADFHQLPSLRDIASQSDTWRQWNEQAEQRAKEAAAAVLPNLDHLTWKDFEHVYEPSDDTYLLLDALQYELEKGSLKDSFCQEGPVNVLEIGCGSGVPTVFVQQQWCAQQRQEPQRPRRPPLHSFATDINPIALQVTRATAIANQVPESPNLLELLRCDLASALLPNMAGIVDIVLFNPPYVPTTDEEVGTSNGIDAAWAGGVAGRRVVDRAQSQIAQLLRKPTGVAYIITVDDNRPEDLAQQLNKGWGLQMAPLFRRRARNEYLSVQKVTWPRTATD